LFCSLPTDCIISALDVEHIYNVPLVYHKEGLDEKVAELLGIWTKEPELQAWEKLIEKVKNPKGEVKIAIVGKYVDLEDSYKSLNEALVHGGIKNNVKVKLHFVDAETLKDSDSIQEQLGAVHGILVPGGFGERGVPGKLKAIRYARENKVPFYGICLGMQLAVVEFAQNVCKLEKANSLEFDSETPSPVISLMEEQKAVHNKGATMRLGAYPCTLEKETFSFQAYGEKQINERHRHRYEFNNQYLKQLSDAGLRIAGICETTDLVEIVELADHPWFVGCQFHPEFKSRPMQPHPLFAHFVKAGVEFAKRSEWTGKKAEPELGKQKSIKTASAGDK